MAAVEASGLTFPAEGNLLRSFVSSLLAKPFCILLAFRAPARRNWRCASASGSERMNQASTVT